MHRWSDKPYAIAFFERIGINFCFKVDRSDISLNSTETIFLEKLIVVQMVNKFPVLYGSKMPITLYTKASDPYPDPVASDPHPHILFL
jgi:hypothetical protein